MPFAKLTRRGRITLPIAVRTALGLIAGAKIDFVAEGDSFRVVPLKNGVPSLKGRFAGRVAKPVGLDEMEAAIGDQAVATSPSHADAADGPACRR